MKPIVWLPRLLVVAAALSLLYTVNRSGHEYLARADCKVIDALMQWHPAGRSPSPVPVVIVDANFYYKPADQARVMRNLAERGASLQLIDHVFQDPLEDAEKQVLADAVADAGRVCLGMIFSALDKDSRGSAASHPGRKSIPNGIAPLFSYPGLMEKALGVGHLHMPPDPDGILRRIPLLVRSEGKLIPGLALVAALRCLGVSDQDLQWDPLGAVVIKGGRYPTDARPKDWIIPTDAEGYMRINYPAAAAPVPHIGFGAVLGVVPPPEAKPIPDEVIRGKIAVISESVDPAFKLPPGAPASMTTSGEIHAAALSNILQQTAFRVPSDREFILISIIFSLILFFLSVRFSSIGFFLGVCATGAVYAGFSVITLFHLNRIPLAIGPLLLLAMTLGMMLVLISIEKTIAVTRFRRAQQMAERELEIGRRIQADFLPAELPEPEGWEVAAHFQPSRYVTGDFYDAFWLKKNTHLCLVVADVCDKGVGAALFMALFRTLIRVLSVPSESPDDRRPFAAIDLRMTSVIRSVNDYIAVTHEHAHMFATIFYAALLPETGDLYYINAGHDPPVLKGAGGMTSLMPTGPSVGLYPGVDFGVKHIRVEPGDTLMIVTDGVEDALNRQGEPFSRARLETVLSRPYETARALTAVLSEELIRHGRGVSATDDITILALRRTG